MMANDFDRLLEGWLADEATTFGPPAGLHAASMQVAQGKRQRRPWLAALLGSTTARSTRRFVAPDLNRRYLLVVLALLAALAIGSLVAGLRPTTPAPLELGRNGLVVSDQDWHIVVQGLDGSDKRQITTTTIDFWPRWSPDGTRVAAYRAPDTSAEGKRISLWVMRPDGSEARNVTPGLEIELQDEWQFSWSPTSDRIAFASGPSVASGIWVATLDGAAPRQIVPGDLVASAPAWSPDGTAIAFQGGVYGNIYVVNPDGSGLRRLTPTEHPFTGYSGPAWSPDGTKVLFFAGAPGMHDIWVVNRDGSGERAVAAEPSLIDERLPVWSPDGTRIAYTLIDRVGDGTSHVVVMDADGTNSRRLSPPANGPIIWSPDGTRILSSVCLADPCDASVEWDLLSFDPSGIEETERIGSYTGLGTFSWQRLPP
jgi:Tol biopolymer transport system component